MEIDTNELITAELEDMLSQALNHISTLLHNHDLLMEGDCELVDFNGAEKARLWFNEVTDAQDEECAEGTD